MPPRVIPRSYALDAVLELLALPSNSTFYRSGLAGCIAHYPPGVYDADAVEEWAQRLARRRAMIALGGSRWGEIGRKDGRLWMYVQGGGEYQGGAKYGPSIAWDNAE